MQDMYKPYTDSAELSSFKANTQFMQEYRVYDITITRESSLNTSKPDQHLKTSSIGNIELMVSMSMT